MISVVTGGAGFIGSHMVDLLLEEGHEVRVIDNLCGGRLRNLDHVKENPKLKVEVRDIREVQPDDALFAGVNYVFHFAGIGDIVPSIERPIDYMDTNVQGTVRILEAARHAGVKKFVYAASSSCFGLAEQVPTPEGAKISPQYPYALSKYMGEMSTLHWGNVYKLPVNCVRIFNAYGTRSRTSGAYGAVFGVFLKQKLAGKKLTVVGDGTQSRDFLYVTDVARAFYEVGMSPYVNEVFNLGAGNPQSVNKLVEILGEEYTNIPKRPGEPDVTWADITKITEKVGWKPRVAFEEGVKMMLDQIEYWSEAPLWDEASIKEATKTWFKYLTPEA
jgi:UDP-glucose 4-epimerase